MKKDLQPQNLAGKKLEGGCDGQGIRCYSYIMSAVGGGRVGLGWVGLGWGFKNIPNWLT